MTELYKMLVKKAKEQVEKEKATNLSDDTYKLIALVMGMHFATEADRMEKSDTADLPPIITAE